MRGQPPSNRALRRERLAGNWGGASEQIGRRWEVVGLETLDSYITSGDPWPGNGFHPIKIVPLAEDPSLQLALSRSGLPSPDVIVLVAEEDGAEALQALDFKWNLEFASYTQISSEALFALMQKGVKPLQILLSEAIGDGIDGHPTVDGLLWSPRLPVNDWFLPSDENLRQEYPIEAKEVVFREVDPYYFFEPLHGWETAVQLARVDRSESKLRTLDGAEHYYRLGAGLQGATAQLEVSVFVRQPPAVTTAFTMERLRAHVRMGTSESYLSYAEKQMLARSQLMARLRAVARSPYRFSDLVEALRARNITMPEKEDSLPSRERERWGVVLRKVAAEHKELIYRTGLKLTEAGLSDADALTRLEAERKRYAERARTAADRFIDQELEQSPV